MEDARSEKKLKDLLTAYKAEDYNFPGEAKKRYEEIDNNLREEELYKKEAEVICNLLDQIEAKRQEREAETYNLCGDDFNLGIEAEKEIGKQITEQIFVVERMLLRRRSSRDLKRTGQDIYEQAKVHKEVREQEEHLQNARDATIRRLNSELDDRQEELRKVATRHQDDTKVKGEFPSDLNWNKVTIQIASNDSIKIRTKGYSKTFHYANIGFLNKRKGDLPDTRWSVLRNLLRNDGEITNNELSESLDLKAAIKDIRKRLKEATGIEGDPIKYDRTIPAYKAEFIAFDNPQSPAKHNREEIDI